MHSGLVLAATAPLFFLCDGSSLQGFDMQCPLQTCPENWPNGQKMFCSSPACGGEQSIDGTRTGICKNILPSGCQTPECIAMGGCGTYCRCIPSPWDSLAPPGNSRQYIIAVCPEVNGEPRMDCSDPQCGGDVYWDNVCSEPLPAGNYGSPGSPGPYCLCDHLAHSVPSEPEESTIMISSVVPVTSTWSQPALRTPTIITLVESSKSTLNSSSLTQWTSSGDKLSFMFPRSSLAPQSSTESSLTQRASSGVQLSSTLSTLSPGPQQSTSKISSSRLSSVSLANSADRVSSSTKNTMPTQNPVYTNSMFLTTEPPIIPGTLTPTAWSTVTSGGIIVPIPLIPIGGAPPVGPLPPGQCPPPPSKFACSNPLCQGVQGKCTLSTCACEDKKCPAATETKPACGNQETCRGIANKFGQTKCTMGEQEGCDCTCGITAESLLPVCTESTCSPNPQSTCQNKDATCAACSCLEVATVLNPDVLDLRFLYLQASIVAKLYNNDTTGYGSLSSVISATFTSGELPAFTEGSKTLPTSTGFFSNKTVSTPFTARMTATVLANTSATDSANPSTTSSSAVPTSITALPICYGDAQPNYIDTNSTEILDNVLGFCYEVAGLTNSDAPFSKTYGLDSQGDLTSLNVMTLILSYESADAPRLTKDQCLSALDIIIDDCGQYAGELVWSNTVMTFRPLMARTEDFGWPPKQPHSTYCDATDDQRHYLTATRLQTSISSFCNQATADIKFGAKTGDDYSADSSVYNIGTPEEVGFNIWWNTSSAQYFQWYESECVKYLTQIGTACPVFSSSPALVHPGNITVNGIVWSMSTTWLRQAAAASSPTAKCRIIVPQREGEESLTNARWEIHGAGWATADNGTSLLSQINEQGVGGGGESFAYTPSGGLDAGGMEWFAYGDVLNGIASSAAAHDFLNAVQFAGGPQACLITEMNSVTWPWPSSPGIGGARV